MEISVLMSVAAKERAENLEKSLVSVFTQTLAPNQVILVVDGPISQEVKEVTKRWQCKEPLRLTLVCLEKNVGLAIALNIGLKYATGEFIARMDSDDICLPARFESQIDFLSKNPEVDVVGTWICEIDENDHQIKDMVEFPTTHEECLRFFEKRNPLAHPTVIFRRSFFEKIGRAYSCKYFRKTDQDTELWYQGFQSGCKFANVPKVLFKFRRSSNFYMRRSGLKSALVYLRNKIRFNRGLHFGILADLFAICYFLMMLSPSWLKKILYRIAR